MNTAIYCLTTISNWLENHNGAITAIATIFLAIFTWRLWVSTNRLWGESKKAGAVAEKAADAARKAAEVAESALIKVERPYLLITTSEFNMGVMTTDNTGSFYHPVVTYSVSNHGKLPAIIDMVYADIIHAPDQRLNAPGSVSATHPLLRDRVLESNGWRQNLQFVDGTIDATVAKRADLTDMEIFFWIKIDYHGPFTKGHQTSGCWRLSFEHDKLTLIQHGQDDYNYTK